MENTLKETLAREIKISVDVLLLLEEREKEKKRRKEIIKSLSLLQCLPQNVQKDKDPKIKPSFEVTLQKMRWSMLKRSSVSTQANSWCKKCWQYLLHWFPIPSNWIISTSGELK